MDTPIINTNNPENCWMTAYTGEDDEFLFYCNKCLKTFAGKLGTILPKTCPSCGAEKSESTKPFSF